ncbi:MAG: acyl-CoA thioesterase [Promethearchaeota archaeon]|nr:MAG: acyl-CoA thioesterase [Candidatus Lokiarchaeota archaeon]
MEKSKTVAESKTEIAQLMMPTDANPAGNVHGGTIMKLIDQCGAIVASRHSHANCVTASVDRIDFLNPAYIGNVVTLKASMNYVGKTSMEIGVRIEDECLITGTKSHIASAYITYVALDADDKPIEVPRLIPETEEEKRRFREAQERREKRMGRISKEVERKKGVCVPRPSKVRKK